MTYLFFFLFLSVNLFSQKQEEKDYRLYGYVYLPDREPASYASIQVKGTTIGTMAREDGYYDLRFLLKDSAVVEFSVLGCKPYQIKVDKKKKVLIQRIVYLEEDALLLEEAQVKDFAKQSNTMNRIDTELLKSMPNISGGIESVISTFAGVSSRNELSSQYSVRGGNYDENSVYVNDIEVYRPLLIRSGEQEGLSFVNQDMVESVQFSAGGFAPSYGDKSASVLDIQYKKPVGIESTVSASLLGANGYVGHGLKNGKFTQLHGIRYKSSDYLFNTLDTEGSYNQRFVDYQTYFTFQFSKRWSMDLLGNYSQNWYSSIPQSRTSTYGTMMSPTVFNVYFDGQEKDVFRTIFGALTLRYKPIEDVSLRLILSAYNASEKVNYDISGEYWIGESMTGKLDDDATMLGVGAYLDYARNRLNTTVANAQIRGDWKKNRNKLEWGVAVQYEEIADKIVEFQLRDSADYSLPYNPDFLQAYYNLWSSVNLSSVRVSMFVQDEARFLTNHGTYTLLAGLRASYWDYNNEFLISPRATVAFFPKKVEDLNLRFSTGLYYQSPFYKEIRRIVTDDMGNSSVVLNNKLKSQRSLHFLLGADYYFKIVGRPFKFTTELYFKPMDRVVTYSVDNLKIVYSGENDAIAYTAGVDFKLFGEFVPGTDSWISLSLMRSQEKKNGTNEWVSRPNEQRYGVSMFFQDYIPGLPKYKFHIKFVWQDGLPFWATNVKTHTKNTTNRTTAYRRVDLGASRRFAKGDFAWLDRTKIFTVLKSIDIGLEIFNLIGFKNVASYYWVTDVYSYQHAVPNYLTGRQFNVKLSFNF